MIVECEGVAEVQARHYREAGAVGKTPLLVAPFPEQIQCLVIVLWRNEYQVEGVAAFDGVQEFDSRGVGEAGLDQGQGFIQHVVGGD